MGLLRETLDKNEDKNVETEEDMEMGDISLNLGVILVVKMKLGRMMNDELESLEKNEGSDRIGNEDISQGAGEEENVDEELGKDKDLGKEEAKAMEHPKDKKMD